MIAKFAADFENVIGDIGGDDSVNREIKVVDYCHIFEDMPSSVF